MELLMDAMIDSIKLLPFLFITYLIMELLEHKAGGHTKRIIRSAGKVGPLWGSFLGAFPQCGFSAAASSMYAGRVITLGTLFSIYLSTSDEMLPIMISEAVAITTILKVIATKIIIGMTTGFLVDFMIFEVWRKKSDEMDIHKVCEEEKCHCGDGVLISSVKHTLKIFAYILVITLLINGVVEWIGEDTISQFFTNVPILGEMIAALVGLIPNCASSVVITKLYISGIIGAGAMMAGLLSNAGVGILVLLRLNKKPVENVRIILGIYFVSVIWGTIISLLGIAF